MNLEFLTLDFKQKKIWILSFSHSISNRRKKKKYKPRKRRKDPKKERSTNPRKRKPRKKERTQKKERKKKKIHSKEEDPWHTQIQYPSSTSRSSIYGTVHDIHHRANDLNKLHVTLKDVNDLKEKDMEERWTGLRLFFWFFNQNCLSWSNAYVGIACFLLSWFVLKRVLLLFGFWRVEHLLEIGGLVLDWSFFFLKSSTFVGLSSIATHWNSSLSSTWNFYSHQQSQNSGTQVFKTWFAIELEF